jgi:hypothetical protein
MMSTLYLPAQAAQGLDLAQLLQSQIYTDVTLHVLDLASGGLCFQMDMHRVILHAASLHFRRLMAFAGQSQQRVIQIQLDMTLYPAELVRLFFSLFYVTVFDALHLSAETQQLIGENVLFLYQLASHYLFDSLRAYCETRLFASFSLDHFKLLSDYALVPSVQEPGRLSVSDERLALYARYLQWYQCCVEKDNNKQYTDLMLAHAVAAAATASNESGEAQPTIDRHYFSCNKAEILDELRQRVDNVAQCLIPEHSVRTGAQRGARALQYYWKICADCLKRGSVTSNDAQYSNIGCIRKNYTNGHECYAFRLRRPRHTARHFTLEMCVERERYERRVKRVRHDDDDEEMVLDQCLEQLDDESSTTSEEERASYSVRCDLTLLSKRLVLSQFSAAHTDLHDGKAAEVCQFELDERAHCYSGRCQNCHHSAPLYILLLRVALQRQKSDSSMSIES